MPIHCPLSSPPKLCRGRRSSESNPGGKTKRNTQKSPRRNFDQELLQHVRGARCQSLVEGVPVPTGADREDRTPSPSLPYSKDFGSFDLTLCLAKDGRCVVLVEHEQRIFVNGRQVYIQDGGEVLDRLGRHNATFQSYYDSAIKAKKLLRGRSSRNRSRTPIQPREGTDNARWSPGERTASAGFDQIIGGNDRQQMLEKNRRITFESELTELEAGFGRIIARLCKLILDVIGHEVTDTESTDSADASDSHQRNRLQTALDRLSDQFQSIIELSTSLKAQHESAEIVQNVWRTDGDVVTSGGDTTGRLEAETIEGDEMHRLPKARSGSPHCNRFVTKPHALWEENQALRKDVRALEVELQQLEQLHKKVEDQFFEAESERVDAQNQLASTSAEKEALKKQLARLTQGKGGGNRDTDSSPEGSASNLLTRFAKRLSGSTKHVSPVKAASSSASTSSIHEEIKDIQVSSPINNQGEQDVLKGFRALDRHHNLRSEMKRLRQLYKNMEEDMEKLGEENSSLHMRVLKMERERKELKDKIREADGVVEDRKREIENLDCANSKLDARCSLLASDKVALTAEITRVNALCAETVSRLRTVEKEQIELEKMYEEAETEKLQCRDRLDQLNQAHLEECSKNSKLLKEKASVEGQLSRLRREQGELAAELDKLRVENDANAAGRHRAEKENNRMEMELQAAERCQAELTDDVHHLRRSLAKSETNRKSLEAESAKMKDSNARLDTEAAELRARSEELYLGARMLEEENSCLKEMNRQLQAENAEMQQTVSCLTDTNAGIRAKMRQWNRENISMENKMKKLVQAKAELHGVIQQLNTVHSDIENRFEKLDSEYADFEVRFTKSGKNRTPEAGKNRSSTFEEDFQREFAQLEKQLRDQTQEAGSTNGEKVQSRRSKDESRRRSSSRAVANLKKEFAELEEDLLGRGGENTGEPKRSPQNGNDMTFVSACSDFESGEQGLWWDDTGELSSPLVSVTEDK